ncbi:membrane protease YdiL (CAAX protease family) [Myceligenerans xiligouense]|uniref:Membrane protease YdiL (CAAX protease family) n=1 Tax=Myceligenerans xiligouense TaxID=253184 RepID=A0A3N4YMM8_9MICO|nr:membrane protease YdiL (CAAX protease family) [Myceligenerans xiligouense]
MSSSTIVTPSREPITSGVQYHRVLAGEKRRIGRGVLAIVLLVGGLFTAIQLAYLLAVWVEGLLGSEQGAYSPLTLGAGLAATALLTPWSMLIQRWLYGVPGPSLHSVVSRFRFDLFGRALIAIVPLFVIAIGITEYLDPRPTVSWSHADIVGLFVVVVLLVPLQSAGEEYGLRGLVFRIAGSWVHGRWTSLILGTIVSSAIFAVIHVAADPWWNVFYLVFSITASFMTWRTGGVEYAVVMHAVYNVLTFTYWFIVNADLADRFDRSASTVTAPLIVPSALAMIAIAVMVWIRTRRTGPAKTPATSSEVPEVTLKS